MRRVYKKLCPATISASITAANMWKNSLKTVESDNNKILYETLLDFLQRNGTYWLNKPRFSYYFNIKIIKLLANLPYLNEQETWYPEGKNISSALVSSGIALLYNWVRFSADADFIYLLACLLWGRSLTLVSSF